MNHQQILDKLASKYLVQSIDEDLARLTFDAMCYRKNGSVDDELAYILPRLLDRWNNVLRAQNVPMLYQQTTSLILAIVLHKYGYADPTMTRAAVAAIGALNEAVALDDDFFRKSNDIIGFLTATPAALKRKPSVPESITFFRAQDVIAIALDNKYHAAYVHELTGQNESPVIEYYGAAFDRLPTLDDLHGVAARGQVFNDGVERISRFAIHGMKFLPDLANQVHLISACVQIPPANDHLATSAGLYAMSDLFQMQAEIRAMFQPRL